MSHDKKFYVTTPIYYVTARPHLGTLYSTLLADVIARWQKLQGKRVFFLTGTDEHGQKIAQAAEKNNKKPKEFVDSLIGAYKDTWKEYEIEYDYFIRTTDSAHIKAVQTWLEEMIKRGEIYKSFYQGWYCTHCETFVTEKDTQKDTQAQEQVVLCLTCSRPTHIVSEESYFFRLSFYQEKLLKFYKENPNFITPKERFNEVISFVESGLKDLSVSRTSVTWGIPFPQDPQHLTYVWADALNNYITAVGYGQTGKEKDFEYWWPADIQVLGKDIIRFHAVFWPAFLMATGLRLPKKLLVHGWIKVGDQKMSKSFGNAIDPQELFEKYGPEPIRYYLLKQMAINQDGSFSIGDLEQHITSDLANDLGNLLNRMVLLAQKNNTQNIPRIEVWAASALELQDACSDMVKDVQELLNDYAFHLALARIWKFIGRVNAYFHAHEPWKIAKSNPEKFVEIMSATCHGLRAVAILLWPVMPHKMEQLLQSLGHTLNLEDHTLKSLERTIFDQSFILKVEQPLFQKPEPRLLAGADKGISMALEQATAEYITIDDVAKVQLVIGTIEQCEQVSGSDKLLKLQVNFGELGVRQILSGVAQSYKPEELQGKQGIFITNLKPRMMMGLESQGMMLFAKDESGKNRFVTASMPVPNGTKVA